MKKIFTLLSSALLAGMISASADTVTVYVQDEAGNDIAQSFETELTQNADGSLTLADFLNSECPASFKFEIGDPNGYCPTFEMTGNLDRSDTYPYILTEDGLWPTCYLYDLDGGEDNWKALNYPYVCEYPYSWVWRYDMSTGDNTYEYYASICISGWLDDDTQPWLYLNFFFNIPEVTEDPSGVDGIAAEENAPVEYFNLNGIRVSNPENGLYIRRQGSNVSKVIL